jgi:eukaryotic-like serine/threonine-protein kinase
MDSDRWQKVQALFHETADLPEREQRSYLETKCGGDAELVSEVLVLLQEDAHGESLLDGDVAQVAHQIFEDRAGSTLPFQELGPYRIIRALGEGGMGMVYLAERQDLGSQVAVKVLRDAWLSPARRERFAVEQRTLAQLNHASIARLYDANSSADGTPFFVMEYVEGVPLTEYCTRHNCSIPERLRLFREVCEAVVYAHQHAVIHRDLKPSNILVKEDGSVRLLDFGIAKHLESLGENVEQTMAGLRLMTPAYAAPEQIRGEQVGIQTDVYSLGVVLYEMLSGRLPFDLCNRTPAQAEKILIEEEAEKASVVAGKMAAVSPEKGRKGVYASKAAWGDLDVLCMTAMHKDAEQRYQSVEGLIRDIDHYLNGEPLEARADTAWYRLRKYVTRNWKGLATAGAVTGAILGMLIFFTLRLAKARNAAIAEAARTQRIQKFMTNLFQGGDADAGPADSLRVVTLLDRGVQEAQSLSADPEVQAELYQTLGTLYENLGKYDRADSLLNLSLAERKSLYGADHVQVAESMIALGLLRDDQGRLPEAESLVREGLAMNQRHLPPDHPAVVKATTALGKVLADRGSYDESIRTLEKAVSLQPQGDSTPELAASLYELANAHFSAGQYDAAEQINERLLLMYREIYGEGHPRVADILMSLGEIQNDLGHYPQAEKYERQAVDMMQGWYGKDSPETATDLTILARTIVYEKRYDEAVALLGESLAIKELAFGEVHPSVASSLNDLGNAASMQGKYDLAEKYFKREADIYRSVYGEHHYLYATALSNLASVYSGRKEWKQAEMLFRQVIPIYVETQSANNRNTGIARIKLGRTLLRQNRYAEAEKESRGGYDILSKQMDPKVSWLVNARKDLVEEYEGLKEPEEAAKFKVEIAELESKGPESGSGTKK